MLKRLQLKHLTGFMLLLILVLQVPFLQADPHKDISPDSRDAFTDEGLNTSQVTNKINHGYFGVHECDNLIKTPLFNAWIYPAYLVFGTKIVSGRFWMLLTVLGLIWLSVSISRELRIPILLFGGIFLTQYHLFQYLHFTMAEMSASALVLLALTLFFQYAKSRDLKWGLASALILWIVTGFKNQFAYTLLLLPAFMVILQLFDGRKYLSRNARHFSAMLAVWFAGGLIYYLFWYLPVKETYDYVMSDQAGNRFIPRAQWSTVAWEQTKKFFGRDESKWMALSMLISLLLSAFNYGVSKNRKRLLLSLFLLIWALAECHKLTMWFVPSRYLSPLLFAWGLFASLQLSWALENAFIRGQKMVMVAAVSAGAFFLFTAAHHTGDVIRLFRERSFAIRDINHALKKERIQNRVAAGPWAPTLARESGAKVIPVWDGYFNYENTFERFYPKVVIAEWDEADSGGAFRNQGISLKEKADSVSEVQVGHYRLMIYFFP